MDNKRKIVLAVIIFLVFVNICTISYILAFTSSLKLKSNTVTNMQGNINTLNKDTTQLVKQSETFEQTQSKVNDLEKTTSDLSTKNSELSDLQIETEKKLLEAENKIAQAQSKITETENKIKQSESKVSELLQKGVQSYYPVTGTNKYNLEYLKSCLKSWKPITAYKENVYDCSEMSAHLEWYLESRGIQADIVTSKDHAWVFAHGTYGYIAIEATTKELVYYKGGVIADIFKNINPSYYDKNIITARYSSIFDAPDNIRNEFDWWSCKGDGN